MRVSGIKLITRLLTRERNGNKKAAPVKERLSILL
jgi:hypothetical protein